MDGITDSTDMGLCGLWKLVMDREAWHASVHGVAKSWTGLSDLTFNFKYTFMVHVQRLWSLPNIHFNPSSMPA